MTSTGSSQTDGPIVPADDVAGARTSREGATLKEAAREFLSQRRIAVVGVSRDAQQPANLIYRRLRDAGHEVFAVNPNAAEVEGDLSYPAVSAVAGGVDGVVIVTPPEEAIHVIEDAANAGVQRVWLHRGIGQGSTSPEAVDRARALGMQVIPAGCPNMFGETSDLGHRCMCAALTATHKIPSRVPYDCAVLQQ